MKKIIAVIDLGSSRITAAAAGINKGGKVLSLALENLNSRGITGGDITDINKTVEDISSVMGRLQRQQRKMIKNVFVTTKGADIRMDISRGMVPLSKTPREIAKKDVKRCLEIAEMISLPPDRAVLEKIVRGFYIDGGMSNVGNPVGLYGIKLEVEAFVATANRSKIQNITKCIDHAGFFLSGIYLSGTASANSVLDAEEKEKGTLLIDIGESLTEELIFKNNRLKYFRVIEKGASTIRDNNMRVDKEKLDALLKEVGENLPAEREGFSSVVVTGGGALIDGIIEKAERMFKIPSRIGIVKNAGRRLNSQDAIIHTPTIGLIDRLAKEYKSDYTHKNPIRNAFHKVLDIYESYF